MLRGEFRRGDGLVIPNNVTSYGAETILRQAIRDENTLNLFVGLCRGLPRADLEVGDIYAPEIGANGYARIALSRNSTDWPVVDTVNDEVFIESKSLVWTATGGEFSEAIQRMFICYTLADLTGAVFALSAPLESPIVITPSTPVLERTYKYRLYLR